MSEYQYSEHNDGQSLFCIEQYVFEQRQLQSLSQSDAQKPLTFTNYTDLQISPTLPRAAQQIETAAHTIPCYLRSRRGHASETMQLHHNFKTILTRQLKDLLLLKVLSPSEIQRTTAFFQAGPSFQTIIALLDGPPTALPAALNKFLAEGGCVRKILTSKIRMSQKLVMLKFLQKLRWALLRPGSTRKWKKL